MKYAELVTFCVLRGEINQKLPEGEPDLEKRFFTLIIG